MDKKEEPQKPIEEEEIDEEEEEDLFNKRIENSGCSKQHYELQVDIVPSNLNYFSIQLYPVNLEPQANRKLVQLN